MKKVVSQGLVVAALLSLSVPTHAFAAAACGCQKVKPPVLSQELVVGPIGCCPSAPCRPGAMETLPQLKISQGANTELHLLNPQAQAVRFNVPELGISYLIPANSERTIYLDQALAANLSPGQTVAYDISTENGCQKLAYSCLVTDGSILSQINTSRSFAVMEEKPAPRYHAPVKRHSRIRGYW